MDRPGRHLPAHRRQRRPLRTDHPEPGWPRKFAGAAAGDTIAFERDGAKESVHASDGNATGMKWLAGKSNCLTVRAGEGYCRD